MLSKKEYEIINLINEKCSISRLAAEMPEDCLQYMVDMIAPPFPIETQEDKEIITFMYISSLIRYIYVEHEGRDENGKNRDEPLIDTDSRCSEDRTDTVC